MAEKKIGTLIKVVPIKRQIADRGDSKSGNPVFYDSLLLYYRDKDGKKQKIFEPRAEIPYSIIIDKECPEAISQPMFIEADKVKTTLVWSDELYNELGIATGTSAFVDKYLMARKISEAKNVLLHPWVYDADMDIGDRYIQKFTEEYEPDIGYNLHKAFFDIECDLDGYIGFPDEDLAPCPACLITLFDQKTMTFHCHILKNPKNKNQAKVLADLPGFEKYVKDWIKTNDGLDVNFQFYVYDNELEEIAEFFKNVHRIDPDFCCAWNAGYDCKSLQNRLKKLVNRDKNFQAIFNSEHKKIADIKNGEYTADEIANYLICDERDRMQTDSAGFPLELFFIPYFKQEKEKNIVDRTEAYMILDGTVWQDQMGLYASIRKTSGQKESYSLDAIAGEELGKEKLPFAPGETIKNLPWINFKKFLHYNIVDVLRLYQLESKNLDLDMIQRLSEITNTRKEKVFKKTISLKNFVSKFARDSGFVMADNRNARYGEDGVSQMFKNNFIKHKTEIQENDPVYKEAFGKKENYGA